MSADMIVELLRAEKPANYLNGDGTLRIDKKWLSLDDIKLSPEDVARDDRYYLDTSKDTPGMIVVLSTNSALGVKQ